MAVKEEPKTMKQLNISCMFGHATAKPPQPPPKATRPAAPVKRENPICLAKPVGPPPPGPLREPPQPKAKAPTAVKSAPPPPPSQATASAPEPEVVNPVAGANAHEADSAGGQALNPWDDKSTYNKLNHKMRGADPSVRQAWQELLKTKNHDDIQTFMDTVLSNKRGGLPDDFVRKCQRVEKSEESVDEGGYFPWKEIADKEGHDALLEMVKAGTVVTRRHPKLPADSAIPYPYNQQVAYVVEKWKATTRNVTTEDGVTHTDADKDTLAAFENRATGASSAFASRRAGTGGAVVAHVPQTAPDPKVAGAAPTGPSPRDKEAVANVRKANGLWDRAKREYTALVSKSKACSNTQGCTFEQYLEAMIKQGVTLDADLMKHETKFLEGKSYSNDDVSEMSRLATAAVDIIKAGNKKASALRPWFKVE